MDADVVEVVVEVGHRYGHGCMHVHEHGHGREGMGMRACA